MKKKETKSEPEKIVKANRSLFVKNFAFGTDDEKLKAIFSPYGEVESAQVAKDE